MTKGIIKRDSKKALKQIRTLGNLVYSNSEFRKLLADANILFRDIFADAASAAAHFAVETAEIQSPSRDELNNINNTADGGQDKDKKSPSTEETKDQADKARKHANKKGKDIKKQAQKKGKKTRDDVQEYLSQKFPKQRQDAIIYRLKKVLCLAG